jgi:hypothetical protein
MGHTFSKGIGYIGTSIYKKNLAVPLQYAMYNLYGAQFLLQVLYSMNRKAFVISMVTICVNCKTENFIIYEILHGIGN